MKWAGAIVAAVAIIGYAISTQNESCVETKYSGGRLIECESTAIFQPARAPEADATDANSAGVASIPLPPRMMALLGSLLYGGCETTTVPEGQWTVCDGGFSLLERGGAPVASLLRLAPDENPVAKAERKAAAARADIDLPVEDSDCGPFPCSAFLRDDDDPKRNAYLLTLSDYEIAHLGALLRAFEDQEIDRALEQARAQNTALQARMKKIVAHEAELERADAVASHDVEPERAETVARIDAESLKGTGAEASE